MLIFVIQLYVFDCIDMYWNKKKKKKKKKGKKKKKKKKSYDVSLTLFKSYLDNEVMIMCGSVY